MKKNEKRTGNTTFTLPNEHGRQLRAIAKAKGVPTRELLRRYIVSEIEAGTIPPSNLDHAICANGDEIDFHFGGANVKLTAGDAIIIANKLQGRTDKDFAERYWRERMWMASFSRKINFHVEAKGRGLVMTFGAGEYASIQKTIGHSMARQIAQELREAAEKIKAGR